MPTRRRRTGSQYYIDNINRYAALLDRERPGWRDRPVRRNRLTSVARSLMSTTSQRRFSRTSAATVAANMRSATTTLDPVSGRRYVRYRQARQGRGGRYTVESRKTPGLIVGRYVKMAH